MGNYTGYAPVDDYAAHRVDINKHTIYLLDKDDVIIRGTGYIRISWSFKDLNQNSFCFFVNGIALLHFINCIVGLFKYMFEPVVNIVT